MGYVGFLALITGIVGIILAIMAKKNGDQSGVRTAGLIMSIIGMVIGVILGLTCLACICVAGAAYTEMGGAAGLESWANELSSNLSSYASQF